MTTTPYSDEYEKQIDQQIDIAIKTAHEDALIKRKVAQEVHLKKLSGELPAEYRLDLYSKKG